VTVLFLALPSSFGWGENAERIIVDKAVDTLPVEMLPFFQANRAYLMLHVTDPLEPQGRNAAEQPRGFIQLDRYGPFPFTQLPRSYTSAVAKYGKRQLEARGVLPWQIGLYSKKLTDAFRAHNWDDAKTSAALLAHYVAAAHDPFKSTTNNDGTLSNQPGVDERFGYGLEDRYQRFFFLKPNEAAFIRDPTDRAFEMSLDAHSWLENVLLAERVLRPLLRAGWSGPNPPALRRFDRPRILLDDGVDQRRPSTVAGLLEQRGERNDATTDDPRRAP
jgi:hypothetical protein